VTFAFNLKFTGALASAVTFVVPNGKKFYRLHHAGTVHTVTVKVTGQTGVTLNPGDVRLVFCNGTDIVVAENIFALATDLSLYELLSHKDAASGYAGLDSSTKLKFSEFPDPRETVNVYDTTASPPTAEISVATQVAILNDTAAGNYSLAAPTPTTDDGKRIEIISIHAQVHVVSVDVTSPPHTPFNATYSHLNFAGSVIGDNIVLRAYQGNWYVVGTPVGVMLS
jgi:hypothetical protein